MIRAENIRKSYGDLEVLKGVSLNVEEKEIISIVGPSGAGKTTLLQILGTLDRADGGLIKYGDREVSTLGSRALAAFRNREIGFVFQFHQLLPEFNALENVCIPLYIAGRSKPEAEKRAKELLEFLGLSSRLDHKPSELSGGEQQRVAVARALANNPAVILADEPSGNLDTENKQELHKLFFDLRDNFGQTIIIVTHDRELAQMSDRVIQLIDGRIV
ncbi:MAG: ABC transporter ATP-binding protein [Marinilabiliaceae bacterium]|jgi:lipoprotein-releasing system ATP-binding protein|nr:ABC transporter ATP-binding protein [Marinilabiliaceae bacterium]